MPNQNEYDSELVDAIEETTSELDLFAEDMEDRFNAKIASTVSSASCAGSCWTTLSSACSAF